MSQSKKMRNTDSTNSCESGGFVPARRFEANKDIWSLKTIVENASLSADRERVASLDGGAAYSAQIIKCQQALAARAQTEIILRQIFN